MPPQRFCRTIGSSTDSASIAAIFPIILMLYILDDMSSSIVAVRGAVSVEQNPDESQGMISAVGRLIQELEAANKWRPKDLVSIQLTQTTDLKRMNAAAALRAARPEYSRVPLFCAQEPDIDDAPRHLVRILVTWEGTSTPTPVYIGEASALRPDLFGEV